MTITHIDSSGQNRIATYPDLFYIQSTPLSFSRNIHILKCEAKVGVGTPLSK
jgi:hypothetical protein